MKTMLSAILVVCVICVSTVQADEIFDEYRYSDADIHRLLWLSIGARAKADAPQEPVFIHNNNAALLPLVTDLVGEHIYTRVKRAVEAFTKSYPHIHRFMLPIEFSRHWFSMVVATNIYGVSAIDVLDSYDEPKDLSDIKAIRKVIHRALGGTLPKEFTRRMHHFEPHEEKEETAGVELDADTYQMLLTLSEQIESL
jgi:hypothetical protein